MSFQEPLALSFLPHNVGKYYATYDEVGFFKPLHILSFICYLLGFLKLKKLAIQNMDGRFQVL